MKLGKASRKRFFLWSTKRFSGCRALAHLGNPRIPTVFLAGASCTYNQTEHTNSLPASYCLSRSTIPFRSAQVMDHTQNSNIGQVCDFPNDVKSNSTLSRIRCARNKTGQSAPTWESGPTPTTLLTSSSPKPMQTEMLGFLGLSAALRLCSYWARLLVVCSEIPPGKS